jgi:hypothetical protein
MSLYSFLFGESCITFHIPPPSNTNSLIDVDNDTKTKVHIRICALIWVIWNDVVFNKVRIDRLFTDYPFGYILNPNTGIPFAGGAARAYRVWVHPLQIVAQAIFN